jgi:hypothetical protein
MREEIVEKLTQLITAAFGLVAALAWNDAIRSLFADGGALQFMATYGQWAYAVVVTVVAVGAAIWVGRLAERAKTEADANTDEQ